MTVDRLTLVAADTADLATVSALLQDAIVRAGDVAWDRRAHRLVVLASRYHWETTGKQRSRAALRLEAVTGVQQKHWPKDPDAILNLLAITADDSSVTLSFADAISIRAQIECIDALLEDISAAWTVRHTPEHK